MKTQSWNRKQFKKLVGAGVILACGLLIATQTAIGQQTNSPAPDQTSAPAEAPDSDAQASEMSR